MPTSSYDLIVLGDELPGLIAAALCARRGMRSLLLGLDDRPARYTIGPHRLPLEPLIAAGFGRGGAGGPPGPIDRVMKELNLDHTIKRKLRDARCHVQLVGPDQRLDVSPDATVMAREIARELPGAQGEAFARAWNEATEVARLADPLLVGDAAFPGVGFWERREVHRAADRAAAEAAAWWQRVETDLAGTPALALLRLPATLGGAAIDPGPLAIARALDAWRHGAPGLRGDLDALTELLVERVTSASGEHRGGAAAELAQGWSKVSGVRTTGGDDLGLGQLLAALPAADLLPLLGQKKAPKKLVEGAGELRRVGWRYTLNLVVDESGVPEGMAPTVLAVLDPTRPLVGDNAFQLHLGEPDDHGRVVVNVTAILPDTGPEPGQVLDEAGARAAAVQLTRDMRTLRASLIDKIEQVMPFLASHVVLVHSPHEDVPPTIPGGRGGHEPPRHLPVPMRPLWQGSIEHGAGVAAYPYTTGIKNVTLASSQVIPSMGLEGAFAVGWSAAKVVCALAGKKRDYLRDEALNAG